ncbi:MAG: hypothetical protein ACWA5A_11645 [Marinibacterium sp.]
MAGTIGQGGCEGKHLREHLAGGRSGAAAREKRLEFTPPRTDTCRVCRQKEEPEPMTRALSHLLPAIAGLLLSVVVAMPGRAAEISDFVGEYVGHAEIQVGEDTNQRDLSVEIGVTRAGFRVEWTTTTYRSDGRVKTAEYSINFVPSDRKGVFAAAMKRNVFGHEVQLDPMKGEPYVWARLVGDTLTVFSLFVDDDGGYEIQEFNRTLAPGGLDLEFISVTNGAERRRINTFLARQ